MASLNFPINNQILDTFLPYEEICQNLVGFLGDLKTPKFHFEINWPLRLSKLERDDLKVKLGFCIDRKFCVKHIGIELARLLKKKYDTYQIRLHLPCFIMIINFDSQEMSAKKPVSKHSAP